MKTDMKAIPVLNGVKGFNPSEFTRELHNEDGTTSFYLDVQYRLLWFRLHRPNGKIDSEILHTDSGSAVVCCRLYADREDPKDQYLAKATAQRFLSKERFGERFLETAETAAVGRVLEAAGYGTQFCSGSDAVFRNSPDMPAGGSETGREFGKRKLSLKAEPDTPCTENEGKDYEELMKVMTPEDARKVLVDVGRYSGMTLGEIAQRKPEDLEWYLRFYAGNNVELKAGAAVLLQKTGIAD